MARKPLNVWITRAEPGASETAARVETAGYRPVVMPLLTLKYLPDPEIDLRGVKALAFTSANGVRAFAAATPERKFRVFCVGAATAAEAKAAGFRSVLAGEGDVAALAGRIATRQRELTDTVVLHPGAVKPAGDLVGALTRAGIEARDVALYDTVPAPLPAEFVARLGDIKVALLHSPKAARLLAKLLRKHPAPKLRALCLSRAVARPLSRIELAERTWASSPNESALLNLINTKTSQDRAPPRKR